jgi:hypothetical protein
MNSTSRDGRESAGGSDPVHRVTVADHGEREASSEAERQTPPEEASGRDTQRHGGQAGGEKATPTPQVPREGEVLSSASSDPLLAPPPSGLPASPSLVTLLGRQPPSVDGESVVAAIAHRIYAWVTGQHARAEGQVLQSYRHVLEARVAAAEATAKARVRYAAIEAAQRRRMEQIELERQVRAFRRWLAPEELRQVIHRALEEEDTLAWVSHLLGPELDHPEQMRSLAHREARAAALQKAEEAEAERQRQRAVDAAPPSEGKQMAAEALEIERFRAESERIRQQRRYGRFREGESLPTFGAPSVEWSPTERQIKAIALKAVRDFSVLAPGQAEREFERWKRDLPQWQPPLLAADISRCAEELWELLG